MSLLVCCLCHYYCRDGTDIVVVVEIEVEKGSCTILARLVVGKIERERGLKREGNDFDYIVAVVDTDAAEGRVDMG